MKTSNKILITLASLFFLVPLVGMIYESRDYVDAKDYKFVPEKPKQFSDVLEGYSAQTLGAFTAVDVTDAGNAGISVNFIKDAKYGVKVDDRNSKDITFSVNANGVLEIKMTKGITDRHNIDLLIYAPELNTISVANAKGLYIPGTFENLTLNINNVKDFNLRDGSTYKALTIHAVNAPDFSVWSANISALNLDLKDSNFHSDGTSYQSLTINSTGKVNIDMSERDEDKPATVDNLTLNANGKGEVTLKNVNVKQLKGSLSDDITVSMPMNYLKQLLAAKQ